MRYELKYNPINNRYQDIFQILRQHPAGFVPVYKERQINNIYFDTPDLSCFHESTAGVSERKKYRLRWYGPNWNSIINPKLEVKIKVNSLGYKEIHPWNDFNHRELMDQVYQMRNKRLLPPSFIPVCSNTYLRSYFASNNGDFRITIDRSLCFGSFITGASTPYRREESLIVELKYDETLEGKVDWIRQYLPYQRTRYSKYTQALRQTAF